MLPRGAAAAPCSTYARAMARLEAVLSMHTRRCIGSDLSLARAISRNPRLYSMLLNFCPCR